MKILLALAVSLILFTSCFGDRVKEKMFEKEDAVEYPELLAQKLDDFPALDFPYSIDSVFFEADTAMNFEAGNLDIATVKVLSAKLAGDDQSSREQYYLNDFYRIAQAKQDGTYDSLMNDLDIGMTENASCHTIGRLEFGDTMALVIWEINYKSFDACPYFTGHHVLGTLVKAGKVLSCIQLASREFGADAPMSFEAWQLADISAGGELRMKAYSQTDEAEQMVEKEHHTAGYRITNSGFSILK